MESKGKMCQKMELKSLCKCDKCKIKKVDKWLRKKRPSLFPMCYQFRKAYFDNDQPILGQLQVFFEHKRCLCCGYTLLHLAVNVGSRDLVKYYLSRKHDVEVRTDNGETALHLACAVDDSWFVEQLLIAKADVQTTDNLGCTPLQICLSHDKPSAATLKVLFDYGARPNRLFNVGNDPEESIAMVVKANARHSCGVLPLYEAVYKGNHNVARQLLQNGACPNSLNCYQRSLLQVACFNNSVGCAEALVHAGANVNESDLEGRTALHYAIISESTEIVELLLANNCDLWARDSDGYTAFGMAALTNRLQVSDQLLNHGAWCTEVLLMEVLERQCSEVALLILRRGNFRVHDTKFGQTLLYCAIATGQQELVCYLESLGVKVTYDGSDDEEENLPIVSSYAHSLTKTTLSTRLVSNNLVAYRSTEYPTRNIVDPRYSCSAPKTIMPVTFVPSKLVSHRTTDRSIKKIGNNNTGEMKRNCTYILRPHNTTLNTALHSKQSKYAQIVDHCSNSKLFTRQRSGITRSTFCNAFQQNARGHEKRTPRKRIVSGDCITVLPDKEVSSKCGNAATQYNSTKMSSLKSDSTKIPLWKTNSTVRPNMKLFLKSTPTKSLKPRKSENVNSIFHFYCQKKLKSKLTRYESVCL
ncbi:putative ankyrin repeat protein RF_0381 [Phymastichus coffea]|uniref:putative ankyrin repeat protein RF_0381 n=1 Tax=Phymastichus coffea TaxID=108790 RepID=UPI00273C79BC|nr:putative ankyrin repeat protein RF_0381 [Phymastichus coffea]